MENNIIIAGAGTMGKHYARNLVNLWDELNITRLTVVDKDEAQLSKIRELSPRIETEQADATSARMRSIVQVTGANGLIGATQTDSHLDVLKAALTVGGTTTQIRHLLQEKPFGMFGEQDGDFNFIRDLIRSGGIQMNLDSILMFSDIYDIFDRLLNEVPELQHSGSMSVYGKNRTKDTRPAHKGVFGTEGTHAIDIARRLGHTMMPLRLEAAITKQGDLTTNNKDIPISSRISCVADGGSTIQINMSLVFDENIRGVRHDFTNARGEPISIELMFDTMVGDKKLDTMTIRDGQTMDVISEDCVPAGNKMENALRSTFGGVTNFDYGIDRVCELREILNSIMEQSPVRQIKGKPKLTQPPSLLTVKPFVR